MHKYLPSKKFGYILLSIILALAIIYVANLLIQKSKDSAVKITALQSTKQNNKVQEFMALDTDKDGLKDWEEALWKTDPNLADTDKDGTSDGDEIKLNRDPLKANMAKGGAKATDLFDEAVIAANKKIDAEFAKLSQTDQLARTFFSQYLASKSASGESLIDSSKQIILDTAISKMDNSFTPKYSSSDLKISISTSSNTLKEYGNNLSMAFFTGSILKKVTSETDILDRATQNQDEKILDELDPIIASYTKTISEILAITVPNEIVPTHIKFLNDLYFLKTGLEEMKKLFSDPVIAINGIDRYQTSVAGLKKDVSSLKEFFIKKNINYTSNEYGYIWLHII